MVDDRHVAAEALGLLQVVGGQDDGGALLAVDAAHVLPHAAAQLDIDAGGGLVEDQQLRPVHQGPGDHQATLHAAGEHAGAAVALVPEAEIAQQLLGTGQGLPAGHAVVARLGQHDVDHLLELVEVELLGHHAQVVLGPGEVPVDIDPEDRHLTGALLHQGADHAEGGGLAGAVGAQQREEVSFGDVEVDALEGLEAIAVDLGQATDGQSRFGHARSLMLVRGSGGHAAKAR